MAKQQITLSPEALAALRLPVVAWQNEIGDDNGDGKTILSVSTPDGTFFDDCEIAAALAQLINAAFTPTAEPAPESNVELRQAVGL